MKNFKLSVLICLLAIASCLDGSSQKISSPEKNFEHLWQTFDRDYALFEAKGIDWNALYQVYRPKITAGTTDQELFEILSKILGHLNDNHVRLRSQNPDRSFSAGYLHQRFGANKSELFRDLMSSRPLPTKYKLRDQAESSNGVFSFGWISADIGYFHFSGFGDINASTRTIDQLMLLFKNAKALIVDVRRNGGGDDRVGKLIADRFADKKRLYMTTQKRNGPKHSDFDDKKYWYVEPDGPHQFTKSVVLLTDRTSISAAENFTLAMRILPHVTVVGDLTSGCFADVYTDRLPNGWQFGCSYNLFLDHEGFCWEGVGVPPDLFAPNKLDFLDDEEDKAIELAMALLSTSSKR